MNQLHQSTKPWEFNKSDQGTMTDDFAAGFVESVSYDKRLYPYDIRGSIAHATMLHKTGLITAAELGILEKGLREIEAEIDAAGPQWPGWRIDLEDVHMCIEAALIEKTGDAGRKLHTGRSRNDQVAVDLLLWINDAVQQLSKEFTELYQGFVALAELDGEMVMPSYTHMQRAQPIVVGGELIAWMEAFYRCQKRLVLLKDLNQVNPLGAGAIAGSTLPLDRSVTSELLHLDAPSKSSIDSTASRDVAVDFLYSLAMIAMTLSRWAEQWIIYNSIEFGFIKMDGRYTTGSSMMPQKQNPDMLELIRGRCGNVYGALMALLTNLKGLPIGYNRDLQEDKRVLFEAFDRTQACLKMAGRIVTGVRFQAERIESSLDEGFLDATVLSEYLVLKGLPFRTAHQLVGVIVRHCKETNLKAFSQLQLEQLKACCRELELDDNLFAVDVFGWIGAQNAVQKYQSAGNAGLAGFKRELQEWKTRLNLK